MLGYSYQSFYEVRPFYIVFHLGVVAIALHKNEVDVCLAQHFVWKLAFLPKLKEIHHVDKRKVISAQKINVKVFDVGVVFTGNVFKSNLFLFFRAKLCDFYLGPIQFEAFLQDVRRVLLPKPKHGYVLHKFTRN